MRLYGWLAASVPLAVLRAFVLLVLWGWFVVPLGAKPLSLPLAGGLGVIVTFCMDRYDPETRGSLKERYLYGVASTLVALLVGFAWSLFR